MKTYCIALVLIFNVATVWSQSFIGVAVGIDFAKIKETDTTHLCAYADDFNIINKGYSARSLVYGIQGEKFLSKKFSMAISLNFTSKEMEANNCFFVPIEKVKLNSFSGILIGKWYPNDYFYIGTGLSLSYLSNVRSNIHTGTEYPIELVNTKKYGHILSFGVRYYNFLLGPYFINGLNIGKKASNADLKPIDSFGISLGYLLRVSKEKSKLNKRKK